MIQNNQDKKVQSVIDSMHAIFATAVGPKNRAEYMAERGLHGKDWSFSLSADDIINNKIPPNVAGCTGRAKVFCKLARSLGLDCFVLTTARVDDMRGAQQDRAVGQRERTINGHQIIAVRDARTGKLRAFDPGHRKLQYLDLDIRIGADINFNFGICKITAILSPDAHDKITTYRALRDVYVNGTTDYSKASGFKHGEKKLGFLALLRRYIMRENN